MGLVKHLICISMFLSASQSGFAFLPAETDQGVDVILYEDGRWMYESHIEAAETQAVAKDKPKSANTFVKGIGGNYGIWIDANKWQLSAKQFSPSSELSLYHHSQGAFALLVHEWEQLPLEVLQDAVLKNVQAIDPNAKSVLSETREINGSKLLLLRTDFTVEGRDYVYYGYYYVGEIGTIQVVGYSGKEAFIKLKQDIDDLLNGFVVY